MAVLVPPVRASCLEAGADGGGVLAAAVAPVLVCFVVVADGGARVALSLRYRLATDAAAIMFLQVTCGVGWAWG